VKLRLFLLDMATQPTKKRGGLYCVCGGPGGVSCTNSAGKPGISMHKFPSKEKKPDEWKLWVQFVRKHRPDFTPTLSSAICSVHFERSCYPLRYSLGVPSPLKPRSLYLKPGSVPTIDTVVPKTPESARNRRKVSTKLMFLPVLCLSCDWLKTKDEKFLHIVDNSRNAREPR
jgi:hypothetical protein